MYRRAIRAAAEKVFGEVGYAEAKMADIAAEAGVATGTLYNYFSSKEEIFTSISTALRGELIDEIQLILGEPEPLARLRAMSRTAMTFLERHGRVFLAYMDLGWDPKGLHSATTEAERDMDRMFEQMTESILVEAANAGQVRNDIDPIVLARGLGGIINANIVGWAREGCPPGLVDKVDSIYELFLSGAQPRE